MSTDLDTRLRSLSELSPPSHAPLGASELHRRATKRQQRAIALRAVPAVIVVVALLAGAVALAGRTTTTDVVVGPPETTEGPDASGLSERDLEVIGFLRTAAELRHQLDREMVLSAAYASTGGESGRTELATQRGATDAALAAYDAGAATVVPELTGDDAPMSEAIKQADNRLLRLDTNRRSVDAIQTDALGQINAYANTSAALQAIAVGYLQSVDDPDAFRGVLSASNLGAVAMTTATTAAILTIPVEIGYYAAGLPKGANPEVIRADCADDAEAAGNGCPVFADALASNIDGDELEATFLNFASGEQKQLYRAADAGSDFDQMKATAFDDGIGRNDLRGTSPGSIPIDPATWRAAALQRIDRLAEAEQELYARVLTGATAQPTDSGGSGSSPGTPPPTVVASTMPDQTEVSTTSASPDITSTAVEATGTTVEQATTGRSSAEAPSSQP